MLEIRAIPRGFKKNLILIPGWAADYRIFNILDLQYNYLLPVKFPLFDFSGELKSYLDGAGLEKVSLLGWSLGGFLACDFACANPARVEELILSSIREKFDSDYLRQTSEKLRQNKRAWLYKFYQGCFSPADFPGRSYFKQELFQDYVQGMDLEQLQQGLDYLAQAKIDTRALAEIKNIRIFQGESDTVAPLAEARRISFSLPQARFIALANLGHCVFLNKQFQEVFHG